MIEVTSRRMECSLLTPDFSQVPAVALQTKEHICNSCNLVECQNFFEDNSAPIRWGLISIKFAYSNKKFFVFIIFEIFKKSRFQRYVTLDVEVNR